MPAKAQPSLPYFPRHPLDHQCLAHLTMGKGVSMFAPRRRGKTEFLRNELLPAAEADGYRTIYIDLWENAPQPAAAITRTIERAGGPRPKLHVSNITATVKTPVAEVAAQFRSDMGGKAADPLDRLGTAFAHLSRKHKWLLAIDEFQTLAESRVEGYQQALRAGIQAMPTLKLFLTGSSRRGLNNMLSGQQSPFLGMATPVPLEDLGMSFIEDRCRYIEQRTGRSVDAARLMEVFEQLLRIPEYLNQVVSYIVVEGRYDPADAYERWKQTLRQGEAAQLWYAIGRLDQAILHQLAFAPGSSVFAAASRAKYAADQDSGTVTTSAVQSALLRLQNGGLLQPGKSAGEYELANDDMLLFVRDKHRS